MGHARTPRSGPPRTSCRRSTRRSNSPRRSGLTIPQLRGLAYHRDAATSVHYRRFTIPKRDGTERPIWAPMPRLKAAQRWILHNIVERLPVHGAAHGFLAGRSILTQRRRSTRTRRSS